MLQAESLLATVRAEYSSWMRTQQPMVVSGPHAASPLPHPSSMQPSSVETYLGPSYATFQSAVKSSQQQASQAQLSSPSTASDQVEQGDLRPGARVSNGLSAGLGPAATAATSTASSDTTAREGKQQQRTFAAIGFNYSNSTETGSTPAVEPMPLAMPVVLKRPRSPSKPQQSTQHHRAFQELASSSSVQDHDVGTGSSVAVTTTTTSTSSAATIAGTNASDTAASGGAGACHTAKKAFWMA